MHWPPGLRIVVETGQIKLIRAGGVVGGFRAKLLKERNLVVGAHCRDERNNGAANQKLI